MDLTNSLKFIKSQKSPTSASVREKLFIQSVESQINNPQTKMTVKSVSRPVLRPGKVEDLLLQSKQRTQNKISLLQIKKHKEQQEALLGSPIINETSKLIASKSAKSLFSPKATYVQSLLVSSKMHKIQKLCRFGPVFQAKICLDHLDLRPSNCKSPLSYKINKSNTTSESMHKKMLENYYSRSKNRRLFEAVPYKSSETLLELSSIDRNEVWLKQKAEKIEENRKKILEKSMENCTFSPELSPKTKGSGVSYQFRSFDTNYSQKLTSSKCASPMYQSVKRINSPEIGSSSLTPVSLSPHRKKIAFRAGMNLKQFKHSAVPLFRYSSPTPFYYWNRVLRECLFR